MKRRYVNIQLDDQALKDLDAIANKVTRKRKQVIEILVTTIARKKVEDQDYTI